MILYFAIVDCMFMLCNLPACLQELPADFLTRIPPQEENLSFFAGQAARERKMAVKQG